MKQSPNPFRSPAYVHTFWEVLSLKILMLSLQENGRQWGLSLQGCWNSILSSACCLEWCRGTLWHYTVRQTQMETSFWFFTEDSRRFLFSPQVFVLYASVLLWGLSVLGTLPKNPYHDFDHTSSRFNPGQRNELLSSLLLSCHVLLSSCLLFFASVQPHMPKWAVMYAVGM